MTETDPNNPNEIFIVKKKTTMYSDDYFSINLKCHEESIDSLLKKATKFLANQEKEVQKIDVKNKDGFS